MSDLILGQRRAGEIDDSPRLQRLYYDAKYDAKAGNTLIVPPGDYSIGTPLNWTGSKPVDVKARGARFIATAGMQGTILTYGADDTHLVWDAKVDGPSFVCCNRKTQSGVIWRNLNRCNVSFGGISDANTGSRHICTYHGYNYNEFTGDFITRCLNEIGMECGPGLEMNANRYVGLPMLLDGDDSYWADNPSLIKTGPWRGNGWVFRDCGLESGRPGRLLNTDYPALWIFDGCWREGIQKVSGPVGCRVRLKGETCSDVISAENGAVIEYCP